MRVQRRRVEERWSWTDLRLVPPALAVWSTTLLHLPPTAALAVSAGAVTTAVAVHRSGRGAGRRVALVALAGVLAASAAGAVRGAERGASPVLDLAERGSTATLVVEVAEQPHALAGGPGPARVLVPATVVEVVGGPALRRVPVVLFGPVADWDGVRPGTVATVRATVRPAQDGDVAVAALSARTAPVVERGPGPAQAIAGELRAGLGSASARVLPPDPAGLLPGLVVGDTSGMQPGVTADFRRAGLGHLTAVSGANVAIVLALLLRPLRRRAVHRRWQAVAGSAGLVGFVLLAGPSPSVLRAGAMGAVTLLALASGRARVAVPALSAAVCVLLVVDPALATDGGFALSVVATAGIVLLAPGWSRRWRVLGLPGPVADALAVSAAAGLVTAPLVAGLSGLVSLVSLPANLLAAPAVAPATVLGLLAVLVAPVATGPADLLVWAAGWPTRWLVLVADRAAAVPDGAFGWPAGVTGSLLLVALLAAGAAALVRWPRTRPLAVAAVLGVVVLGWPARQLADGWPVPGTVLVACDVGQGDALVLPTGEGAAVLVDAGPDPVLVDACLTRLGVERLPLVLLSHLDADHVTGLPGALAGREVGEVATGVLAPTEDRVGRVADQVAAAGGELVVLPAGTERTVGSATIEVLAPGADDARAGVDPNALSVLARVTQHGITTLFTGDLGADREARLAEGDLDLRADVLKVPHHGSGDVDPGFLAAVGARVALVSVGADNDYGHPAARLLDLLAVDEVPVHRTDLEGDLAVVGDAGDWGVTARGVDDVQRAVAAAPGQGFPAVVRATRDRRSPVTRWPRAADRLRAAPAVPAAAGRRRGGAAARAGGRRGPGRGPPAGPRVRGARARRGRAPGGRAGRRARPVVVRRAPARGGHRGARGGGRAGRLPPQLREGPRRRPDAGAGALRREAQRGAAAGLPQGRRRRGHLRQAHLTR
ncbi:ComEC/Rec2 family competence protein [Klenkia sp. PcliD-1-E]|nr:ComEC/Rec2 family competence protein [Klenkia sp. PcliD-1-E]MCO7220637.1 ComEC/Rec2 family competence protein [Klenkia sp. PcliD-1-E]